MKEYGDVDAISMHS